MTEDGKVETEEELYRCIEDIKDGKIIGIMGIGRVEGLEKLGINVDKAMKEVESGLE